MSTQQAKEQNNTPKNDNTSYQEKNTCWAKVKNWYSKNSLYLCVIVFLLFVYFIVYYCFTDKIKSTEPENLLKNNYIITAAVTFLFLGGISILSYYFRKEAMKKYNSIFEKLGSDITHLFIWLFSVEGLLFVLVGVVVSFMVIFICNFSNIGEGKLQLTAFTLNLALCTLIPTLISRIVAKSHLNEIIEKKLETELNSFKTSLYNIRRDKGHSCRMSAVLLYQNAKKEDDISNDISNAIWSIGWASEAITQYLLIKDDYNNAKERVKECMTNIFKSYEIICSEEAKVQDNDKVNINILHRDLISVLTMFTLLKHYCLAEDIERSAQKEAKSTTTIDGIAKFFYDHRENLTKISGYSCRITGMKGDFNRKIETEADSIIQSYES